MKMISWLKAIKLSYPDNPYIALFTGLCCVLANDTILAEKQFEKTNAILQISEYWRDRFEQFALMYIVNNLPNSPEEVYQVIESVRDQLKIKQAGWIL